MLETPNMLFTIVAFYRKILWRKGFIYAFSLLSLAAQVQPASGSELTIDKRAHIPLESHAFYTRDSSRSLDANAIGMLDEASWTSLKDKSLSLGFTRDAVWIRFRINIPAAEANLDNRLLVVDNTLFTSVNMYSRTGEQPWAMHPSLSPSSGATTLYPTFEIFAAQPGVTDYLLRIESGPSLSSTFSLWQAKAWLSRNEKKDFLVGAAYGGYLLLILLYASFAAWTRDPMHLAYTLYIGANFVAALLASAWPRILWPHLSSEFWVNALGVGVSIPIVLGTWFAVLMLKINENWDGLGKRLIIVSSGFTTLGVIGSALGYYVEVIPFVMSYLVILMVLGMLLALSLAVRGDKSGQLFLLAFGLYIVGVLARVLRNLLTLDYHIWIDQLYQAGTFMHMMVMSVGIFTTYSRLKLEAQTAHTRLEAQEKLRVEQRDFLTLVSHELRNPMAIISASTDNMARDESLNDAVKTRVKKIQRATQRIQELMEQFLSNERLLQDSHRLKHGDNEIRALCKAAASDLPEQALPVLAWRNGPAIRLRCDGDLVKVAVYNLMINAWRHSPNGSPIEISISSDEEWCTVDVCDRGPGIPEGEQQHLFKRFYRGTQSVDKPGTGLGLYLVKTIAERHGGHVRASARKNGGTIFSLSLPLQQTPAKPPA
jgi:signal transduction histidine kinase